MAAVTFTIFSEGVEINPAHQVLSIEVLMEINRIGRAELVVIDGDATKGEFPIAHEGIFDLGKEIEVKVRYEGQVENEARPVFKGIVMTQSIQADEEGSTLMLVLKDVAVKLTHERKNGIFRDQSDTDIIKNLVGAAALKALEVETTEPVHAEMVQYYCTDWDFILERAEAQGLVVAVNAGEISVKTIDLSPQPKHSFEYGISEIYSIAMEADASFQSAAIESAAWDVKSAQAFNLAQSDFKGDAVAKAVGFDNYVLAHPVSLDDKELANWANARMMRSRMAMLSGTLGLPGFSDVQLLDVIEVSGVGKHFQGKTVITGIRQGISAGGWTTEVKFGLSPYLFSQKTDVEAEKAAGLLPPIQGFHIGVIDTFEEDPLGLHRLKVVIPALGEDNGAVWARLTSPYAGADRGIIFRPEAGDEVIVGFLNNDPRQAVVLGAMHSKTNASPLTETEDNTEKAIITKQGTTIGFVDAEKSSVFIETPSGNTVVLDDDSESIMLSDQHGNRITLNKDGIEMESAKDFKIQASANVEIAGAKVDIK